jgi:hypothetical protein
MEGKEHADQLTKTGTGKSLVGPEPAWSILMSERKQALKEWTRKERNI